MASHKLEHPGPARLGTAQAVSAQRTPSSRLPARPPMLQPPTSNAIAPTKLVKRKPISHNTNASSQQSVSRAPSKSGVRRVVGEELRREMAPRKLPTSTGIPKSSQQAQAKPSAVSRIARFEPARTPSLISGSSVSTMDSPRSNLLRRKPSNIGVQKNGASPVKYQTQRSARSPDPVSYGYEDPYPNAVFGIAMPPASSQYRDGAEDIINLDRYITTPPALTTKDLPAPPTPLYALSSTPSTGYSPGPFSISSTPTSMSSVSPGIVVSSSSKVGSRIRQLSPTRSRPPTTRKMTNETATGIDRHGLPSVRESSSSSVSTLRGGEHGKPKENNRVLPMSSHPVSPRDRKPSLYSPEYAGRDIASPIASPVEGKPQIHPEFAHLADISPRKKSIPSGKPARPSRDNTPDMSLREMSPIVQSNMSSLPSAHHKRQASSEKNTLHKRHGSSEVKPASKPTPPSLTIDTRSRFGMARTGLPSPSPSQNSALSPLSARPSTRGWTPELPSDSEKFSKSRPSPTIGSKPARFGFFSRRKVVEANNIAAAQDKKARKGPAAGTGHEGYGKFAFRGRSGSTTSGSGSTSMDRSPSTDSAIGTMRPSSRKNSIGSKNGSDVDDFFADRMNPITLKGSGPTRSALESSSQTEDRYNQLAEHATRGSEPLSPTSGHGSVNEIAMRPVLLPSPMSDSLLSGSPSKRLAAPETKQISSEEKNARFGRRASRMSFLGGKMSVSISESNATTKDNSPSMGNTISRQRTDPETTSTSREGNWHQPARADTEPKAHLKPPSKWNFFQRAKSPTRKETRMPETAAIVASKNPPHRSIAHYAMTDATQSINAEELEKIMREAESMPDEPITRPEISRVKSGKAPRHGNSILLPEPPMFLPEFAGPQRPASPKVTLQPRVTSPQPAQSTLATKVLAQPQSQPQLQSQQTPISIVGQLRPSRLAQVGRIPRVVSKRDRERKLSDSSFSRPFMPNQPSPALRNGAFSPEPMVASPELIKSRASVDLPSIGFFHDAPTQESLATSASASTSQELLNDSGEFFTFPNRKNSEQSTTSSSSGMLNLMAHTAIVPEPNAPPGEDEVWNEYDDLIDLLSAKTPKMPRTPKTPKTPLTGSSLGAPFQYSEFSAEEQEPVPRLPRKPSHLDIIAPSMVSIAERLRMPSMLHNSQFLSALPSATTPTSPFRMSDFVAGYGERNLSFVDPASGRLSLPTSARLSSSTARLSLPLSTRPPSNPTPPRKRNSEPKQYDSRMLELAETEHLGFETMAKLRFGALMTSKWLSFGRVLFSPVHFELKNPAEDRVLILDGLGKDWSYYVALTYPNASIYNLGTDAADTASAQQGGSPFQQLTNHRHIHHPSLNSPFPFPKGFFAAVVFRFPVATNEAAYRSSLSECKRVLRPGGYLEVSVLDMDMINMGSRARSALRGLKMQMQAEDEDISLKPISDTIQRLLGRRGFENINRCLVGVPAAGRIPSSRDESMNGEPISASTNSSTLVNDNDMSSFSDLITDNSSESKDGMPKMVAPVGRWWYSRCYESLVLPNGDVTKSIWNDDALIRECEKQGTNLKLMVCFAQKPDCPVRRTISV